MCHDEWMCSDGWSDNEICFIDVYAVFLVWRALLRLFHCYECKRFLSSWSESVLQWYSIVRIVFIAKLRVFACRFTLGSDDFLQTSFVLSYFSHPVVDAFRKRRHAYYLFINDWRFCMRQTDECNTRLLDLPLVAIFLLFLFFFLQMLCTYWS